MHIPLGDLKREDREREPAEPGHPVERVGVVPIAGVEVVHEDVEDVVQKHQRHRDELEVERVQNLCRRKFLIDFFHLNAPLASPFRIILPPQRPLCQEPVATFFGRKVHDFLFFFDDFRSRSFFDYYDDLPTSHIIQSLDYNTSKFRKKFTNKSKTICGTAPRYAKISHPTC